MEEAFWSITTIVACTISLFVFAMLLLVAVVSFAKSQGVTDDEIIEAVRHLPSDML